MIKAPDYSPILAKLGITALNEMQLQTIQAILNKPETVLISPTGSGKTLAFLLPLLQMMDPKLDRVQVLILSPTRELAIQTENVFRSLGTPYKVNCCYGGHPFSVERNNLAFPPAVLIGTPGRIADHFRRGTVNTRQVKILILDEFDKCLELGFQETLEEIILFVEPQKKVLTSATNALKIPEFTGIKNPFTLNFQEEYITGKLKISVVKSQQKDKLDTLLQLICHLGNKPMLVFCNHREAVQRVSDYLWQHHVPNDNFHGGLEQDEREKALIQFRNGSVFCLVTTDLAARGLDVSGVEYIVHYHLPLTEQAFIHRNGRTARMNASGEAIIILSGEEKMPGFAGDDIQPMEIPARVELPELPAWKTLYISAGKKDKINKVDLVGFFIQQGGLTKEEIGRIDVLDFMSFVAVSSSKAVKLLEKVKNEPIKKKKLKIEIVGEQE